MAGLTRQEQLWLDRVASYLGTPRPKVAIAENVPDIAFSNGTIMLGKKFLRDKANSPRRLKKLAHESLHFIYPHNQAMRDSGYYSSPRKDRLSEKVRDDILHGGKQFASRKFGIKVPTRNHNPYEIKWEPEMVGNPYKLQFEEGDPPPGGQMVYIDDDTFAQMQQDSDAGTLAFEANPGRRTTALWAVAAMIVLVMVSKWRG